MYWNWIQIPLFFNQQTLTNLGWNSDKKVALILPGLPLTLWTHRFDISVWTQF